MRCGQSHQLEVLMRRLYYLAGDIDTTRAISDKLHDEGISDWNIHVLAKDAGGLYTHHIHSALPHHHKDLIRTGEIGALYGAAVLFALAMLGLFFVGLSWISTWVDVVMLCVIGAAIGGLVGIRVGLNKDSQRLAGFYPEIEIGKYLIMVDVRKEDKPLIRELMNMEFPKVSYHGNESTFVRPFKSGERVLPRKIALD
jgi:hypothetical protein